MSQPTEFRFESAPALTSTLAQTIVSALHSAQLERSYASLVVSGGRTPALLFNALAQTALDWSRVFITLADERWVEPDNAHSNEQLVRRELLHDAAITARFSGLKHTAPTPAEGAALAWQAIAAMPRPFDLVLLGMGDDGHTASLFPGSPGLPDALNPGFAPACVPMLAPVEPHARVSLNLAALLDARKIVLLLQGEQKWSVYQAALGAGAVDAMPVRAVLRQSRTPVEVYWAP